MSDQQLFQLLKKYGLSETLSSFNEFIDESLDRINRRIDELLSGEL